MAAFSFIQPPGVHLAGGGAYISGLITALRDAGHDATVLTSPALLQPGRITVIDGLAIPDFAPDAVEGAIGLVHHTTALASNDTKAATRAIERSVLPRLRLVVATSEAVAARLREEFAVSPDRLVVIPPGVPDAPRSAGSAGPGCAILSVGALVPRKGHTVLLRALARLFDLDWSLTIAGDDTRAPDYAASLRAQALNDGIADRVIFAGVLNDLAPAWQTADMFALATEWEGYPATIAQAVRRGLPIAVTAGGAAAEILAPNFSVVAPLGDVIQLSRAMRRVIFDRALRADMAEAAWRAGQSLPTWANQAAQFAGAVL
jgi:glycosyltransferase involved in cell wall biosynthesis